MNRRDVLAALGAATTTLAGCSQPSGGTEPSGSSADGAIQLALSGAVQKGALGAFKECMVRVDEWIAVEHGGTQWDSGELSTSVNLATCQDDDSKPLEKVWVDIGSAHEFDTIQLLISETTGTLTSGETATIGISSPLRFQTKFKLDEVETVTVTLHLAPIQADQSNHFQLGLVNGTVTTSPSI